MTTLGKKVALMRDMTDTMDNPDRPPGVGHIAGRKSYRTATASQFNDRP